MGDLAAGFGDDRIRYFNRPENRGKAACCNFALEQARGDFIAYLDDDDLWYPAHLRLLLEALQRNPECGAAYSDLYRVAFIKDASNGQRYPIDKRVLVSRDFNREVLFQKNHVLHVSLMHRKDLATRAGGYDEDITALIDWNITRKLAMLTDFVHVPTPTGEYYAPLEVTDRISHIQVTDPAGFQRISRMVKSDLPPGPWAKTKTMAVVIPVSQWNKSVPNMIVGFLEKVTHPFRFVVVNNGTGLNEKEFTQALREAGKLKNLSIVTTEKPLKYTEACQFGAEKVDAEYLLIMNQNLQPERVEGKINRFIELIENEDFQLIKLDQQRKLGLSYCAFTSREFFLQSSNLRKARAADLNHPVFTENNESFRSDLALAKANEYMRRKNFTKARYWMEQARSVPWGRPTDAALINTYFEMLINLEAFEEAETILKNLIMGGYRPDNLIRMAMVLEASGNFPEALQVYKTGLDAIGFPPLAFESSMFPTTIFTDCLLFQALIGMGNCMIQTGNMPLAEKMFWWASRLNDSDPRPFQGYAKILTMTGRRDQAREVLADLARNGHSVPDMLTE